MIEFTDGPAMQLEGEFSDSLHPEVRQAVKDLETFLGPQTTTLRVTEVGRTCADSERIYTEVAARLLASNGVGLTSSVDLTQYSAIKDLSPVGLKQWARLRPSWHKPFAAIDLGMAHWDSSLQAKATAWCKLHLPAPMWELITEPHGTGPHLHIARRDYVWLGNFPGSLRRSPSDV